MCKRTNRTPADFRTHIGAVRRVTLAPERTLMFDAPMSSNKKPLVLVADDSDEMREMVTSHLQQMTDPAFEVIEASDGEQALALARQKLPDLVVLDVMMPEVSGWEV